MTTKEKIVVMQAFEDGEEIEHYFNGAWRYTKSPNWDWLNVDYRIKPKPFKFETIFETTKNSSFIGAFTSIYETLISISFKIESCKKYKLTIEEVTE